ncbi:Aminoacyl-histidine dipeptidase (Peptidase D) [Methanosarcina barkeri 3]|uniref:Aminoacyl-histidine dipeptidase (Peptidase D) n=1 Tax=Methanosarcina barkeri 3 TaxID=1434107 RepID=A0A0E3SFV5_METBA|nr:aminoacyl-histidine dipeptidase [Methanosarcina barkeri]AKB81219.1 Aminoacyl-histidine dipeptidase (Peptidase D) [Methanosarcina barkeri 3]
MHPKTQQILEVFEEINKIPRRSKHEEQISTWLQEWSRSRGFETKTDSLNNVLIKVPATAGYENSTTFILQGHMDMVCEKCKDSGHDFSRDPIRCICDGDWMRGDGTSIGADDGIALALGLVLAEAGEKGEIGHPPLELLFTVDEETGLTGARGLETGFFEGKILLNLDSEDEGIFIIGCAGGQNSLITLPVEWEEFDFKKEDLFRFFRLSVEGLEGGHSGVEINKQRANGIQLLFLALTELRKKLGTENIRLVLMNGGSVHNAIPSTAEAFVVLHREKREKAEKTVSNLRHAFKAEYAKTDPGLILNLEEINREIIFEVAEDKIRREEVPCIRFFSPETEEKLEKLILGLPHGVYRMSDNIQGLVETSNNLATVRTVENEVMIVSSQRSSNNLRLDEISKKVEAVAKLAGAWVEYEPKYPAWEPDLKSELLLKCKQVYTETFGKEPEVEVIHAGLECGIIGSAHEGMEMISFGPTIKDAHSPSEKIFIPSIEKVWIFLENLFKTYC